MYTCVIELYYCTHVEIDLELGFPIDFSVHAGIVDNNINAIPVVKTLDKGLFEVGMWSNIDSHKPDAVLAKLLSQFFFQTLSSLGRNFIFWRSYISLQLNYLVIYIDHKTSSASLQKWPHQIEANASSGSSHQADFFFQIHGWSHESHEQWLIHTRWVGNQVFSSTFQKLVSTYPYYCASLEHHNLSDFVSAKKFDLKETGVIAGSYSNLLLSVGC